MQRDKSNNWKYVLPILILTVIMFLVYIPRQMQQVKVQSYAEPFFTHAVPTGAEAIQGGAGREGKGVSAAILLKTDLSPEEVIEFYGDVTYPPYKEGQTVQLLTKEVDERTIGALKQAERYEEGASYLFVYIHSS